MRDLINFALLLACVSPAAAVELPSTPQNLDFREGRPGSAPPGWRFSGHGSVEQRENCSCAVILPAGKPNEGEVDLSQTLHALLFRGRTAYLKASLRVEGPAGGRAQLWMRVSHAGKSAGLFDNLGGEPVRSTDWTAAEIKVPVGPDAESIEFGVSASGAASVWIRDVSLQVAGDGAGTPLQRTGPENLGFTRGEPGRVPLFWSIDPAAIGAPPAVTVHEGCKLGASCAAVNAPYSLLQSFDAVAWRGKQVRLRAAARVQGTGLDDKARVWLRTFSPSAPPAKTFVQRTAYHDVAGAEWAEVSLTHRIEDDALRLSLGVTALGGGKVTLDGVFLEVVPEDEASLDKTPATALLPDEAVASAATVIRAANLTVNVPEPPLEEQKRVINLAATRAAEYIAGLPNFICTQVISRSENRSNHGWRPKDVLTVQLGFADGAEHYKLTAIDNRPTSTSYMSLGGSLSEGEFGNVLREIFRSRTAKFQWERQETLRNRTVEVFSYRIEKDKSSYMVEFRATTSSAKGMMVAHHGFVYVDPATGDVLRMVRIAEIPARFPIRELHTILDYDSSEVAGRAYLLPIRAQLDLSTSSMQTRNEVEFRDYRKFEANSSILFNDEP